MPRSTDLAEFGERLERLGVDAVHDVPRILAVAEQTIEHLTGGDRAATAPLQMLERRWYDSLDAGTPDFDVYGDDDYLADLWACWWLYSRRYLRDLDRPKAFPPYGVFSAAGDSIDRILDVGCGIGYSTAVLARRFPAAVVEGTNLPGLTQTAVAEQVGAEAGFTVYPEPYGRADLVFASEYFEHFEEPIAHLREILLVTQPKLLVTANTFGAPSIGHFPSYRIGRRYVDGPTTSRTFNSELRRYGYRRIDAKFWNNRPSVWLRH